MNLEALARTLSNRFPDRGIRISDEGHIVIPAAHAEVGDLTIMDDGEEVTAYVGNITHGHFDNTEPLIEFLEWLFADRVLMWKLWTGGGWRLEPKAVTSIEGFTLRRWYVWSRPPNP